MKSLGATSHSPAKLVHLFADREGLTGKARERFLTVLNETLVPALTRSGGHWRTWALLSALFTPVALLLFQFAQDYPPPNWLVLGCIAYSCIGIAFALGFRRAREISRSNVEMNWVTYCTIFRPALLELVPGLLDRNLAADPSERTIVETKRALSFNELWRDRDEEFWSSSLSGFGLGALIMSLCCAFLAPSTLFLFIPPPLAVATMFAWIEWNRREVRRSQESP